MMSVATTWGTSEEERALSFPCDQHLEACDAAYYRGVTVNASPEVIFRWLCQMRVAPYSYDWIDNLGRQSPRKLTPGLDELEIGQRVMIGELVDFEHPKHLTILSISGVLGDSADTYLIVPQDSGNCRLLVKLLVRYPKGPLGWFLRLLLPWGDLVMMRRQLLNFKELAERTAKVKPDAQG
jgi:hypothetical protein